MPRRDAWPLGRPPVDLDASHAENSNLDALGSSDFGRQEGDRTHRHGPVADPGAGRGPLGVGRRLGSDGTSGQLRPAPAPDVGGCLLYTSDAADDLTRVDLGGRRI